MSQLCLFFFSFDVLLSFFFFWHHKAASACFQLAGSKPRLTSFDLNFTKVPFQLFKHTWSNPGQTIFCPAQSEGKLMHVSPTSVDTSLGINHKSPLWVVRPEEVFTRPSFRDVFCCPVVITVAVITNRIRTYYSQGFVLGLIKECFGYSGSELKVIVWATPSQTANEYKSHCVRFVTRSCLAIIFGEGRVEIAEMKNLVDFAKENKTNACIKCNVSFDLRKYFIAFPTDKNHETRPQPWDN